MAHIMDMANGTVHPVEEPSYQIKRESRTESRDAAQFAEYPQLQLALTEAQTQAKPRTTLPPAAVEALIKMLED